MKISVAWMLDHIATKVTKPDVAKIVSLFNMRTAEIEHYEHAQIDIKNLFIGQVIQICESTITLHCAELSCDVQLPIREDASLQEFFLVKKVGKKFEWSCVQDFNSAKEGLFPAVYCNEKEFAGSWKKQVEVEDFILDVDNKSINHRPDLWGHRGIAREVAAFMGWKMKPFTSMLAEIDQIDFAKKSTKKAEAGVQVEIDDFDGCSRFAALYCDKAEHKASHVWMAIRLARVDSRPINTIVDLTNYVMFDMSQPMHVFDAANFQDRALFVRHAKKKEKLELLDDQKVSLTPQDVIVTDGNVPVALAGVMGGKKASFTQSAQSLIIESASFNATMVRESAAYFKTHTEASSRFAKSLDPMQNTLALKRFLALAYQTQVVQSVAHPIVSVGKDCKPLQLKIAHEYIENKLGIDIDTKKVVSILKSLNFKVNSKKVKSDIVYLIEIPTYRSSKDITIEDDIVEEVGRLYGYENITYELPQRAMKSFDMSYIEIIRKIKQYCAFALKMKEVRDYPFYDESFIRKLSWKPENAVAVKNPVSENWQVLVTSLIPHLLKNIEANVHHAEQMRFFEINSVWSEISKKKSSEHKSLAGVFFGDKKATFYDWKVYIEGLFAMLGLHVAWKKPQNSIAPWFEVTQTADIELHGKIIGQCGMLSPTFVRPLFKGAGFAFEFNLESIMQQEKQVPGFVMWSKYQDVVLDISMLIDVKVTADALQYAIVNSDTNIVEATLVDFFEKEDWGNKRSLTFRYIISSFDGTLEKAQIDAIAEKVTKAVVKLGAEVR